MEGTVALTGKQVEILRELLACRTWKQACGITARLEETGVSTSYTLCPQAGGGVKVRLPARAWRALGFALPDAADDEMLEAAHAPTADAAAQANLSAPVRMSGYSERGHVYLPARWSGGRYQPAMWTPNRAFKG